MRVYRLMMFVLHMLFLSSCSAAFGQHRHGYEEGFRQGAKDHVQAVGDQFQGVKFPFYHWQAPIVQEVLTPAHISNGVMIPEHHQLVIIQPGEWVMDESNSIQSQQRKKHDNQASYSNSRDISNLTVLP